MDEQSLNHSKWECKYQRRRPKCRRKTLYFQLRRYLGEVFRKLAEQKESRIEEGHLMPDHVHMMISIPPKYAVSQVIGFIKGKERHTLGASLWRKPKANFGRPELLARGYFVSTVGRDEEVIRNYIRNQEQEDGAFKQGDEANGHFSGRRTRVASAPRTPLSAAHNSWGRVSDPSGRFERPKS